jgi:hypothetical protein
MKKINTLKACIKFGTKLFHLIWEKKVKCKTCHGKSEKKGEFGSLCNVSLGFKCRTPIMFEPRYYNSIINFKFQHTPKYHLSKILG